jgi:hypothetical protein
MSSSSSSSPTDSSALLPPHTTPGGTATFLPSDTLLNRFRNFYRMATGSMSPTGQVQYWRDADIRHEAIDCRRCESQRDYLLQYSPIIRFMSDNIRQLGGDLGKHNMRCRRCETGMRGGFDAKYGIKLCANWIDTQSQMEDTMAHEMVHAYDQLRFKVDWEGKDLRHVACTEVSKSGFKVSGKWKVTNELGTDPSQFAQWRVPMGERILHEQDLSVYESPSGLREEESCAVGQGTATMQGRCASSQGRQRGLGQLFSRYETIR